MVQLNMDVNLLENAYGISCVENYYIALLKYLKITYEAVFFKSFLPIIRTINDFVCYKQDYLHYYTLERVFKTGEKIGLMHIYSSKVESKGFYKELERNINLNLPLLAMVDYKKLPKENIAPWREDHYVAVIGYSDHSLVLLDDTPTRKLIVPKELFTDAFLLKYLYFIPIESYTPKFNKYELDGVIQKESQMYNCFISDDNIVFLRDALAMIRISRNRVKVFINWIHIDIDVSSVNTYLDIVIEKVNNLFSIVELYRLRKKIDNKLIQNSILELIELDEKWKNELRRNPYGNH